MISAKGTLTGSVSGPKERQTISGAVSKGRGIDGATFIPSVDVDGNLSWTNNKGLANPESVNIKGEPGEPGKDGVITFEEFTEEQKASLKGEKGDPGEPGKDGYTPIKGVDYFDGEKGEKGDPGEKGEPGENSDFDNVSITLNADDAIQTVGIMDQNTSKANKFWTGTKAEYEAIAEKDENTFYYITDDVVEYPTKEEMNEAINNALSSIVDGNEVAY